MIKEALTHFPAPWLMLTALGLFLFAFVVNTVRALSRSERDKQARLANLPLGED